MSKQKIKDISLFWALVPIVVMLGLISIGYFVYNVRAEPMILIGTATAAIIARFHGHTWDDTLGSICSKISEALPIILIVASIGVFNWRVDDLRHYPDNDLLWIEIY
ncbi:Na+/H+ antiporter NhaC [Budvicia aquatica]|uniref:Na+/H+ antiporter NhaC n=1 Tax=Budvicia aquatica TaxID=82979 RepID=A0A484ZDX2_9GAMM|nr:hypothetical protein [Budvicia aquatica]VFS46564.1 Na+/H+ antiporter NhaC [Budvicia aquatica]